MSDLIPDNSPEFALRRAEILRLALGEASRRKRKRTAARAVGGVIITALAMVFWMDRSNSKSPVHRPEEIVSNLHPASEPSAPTASIATIEFIQNDPTLIDRLAIPAQPPTWRFISDDELLQELAAAGQPTGLIRMNDQTFLLPR
jgi:hypothetical protein